MPREAPSGGPHAGEKRFPLVALLFLLPNFIGFFGFTFFPVVLSFLMSFTNWNLKPAIELEVVWLRNFIDLLGLRPVDEWDYAVLALYLLAVGFSLVGLVASVWAAVSSWRGCRWAGVLVTATGLFFLLFGLHIMTLGLVFFSLVAVALGIAIMAREDMDWGPGRAMIPAAMFLTGCFGLLCLHRTMWTHYVPRDHRFWYYLYNTVYMMLGAPVAIAGSLGAALLVSDQFDIGSRFRRFQWTVICLCVGAAGMAAVWRLGHPNLALILGVFWAIAASGALFNIVAFRTIFYLPTFTSGVAMMVLWKAMYNPEHGPINVGLEHLFALFDLKPDLPHWLGSVTWSKPSIMMMGIWTGIGGTNMLLYLAGLASIPGELYEAAHVDGANWWHRFRHITWPQLAPTTFFICIMSVILGLQGGLAQARVMTLGGPAGSTTTLSYYIYNKAFVDLDLGYGSAISWVLFAMIFVGTAVNWKFGKNLEVDG